MPEPVEEKPVRYFLISYNGMNPYDRTTTIGHLAFTSAGFPPLLWMTEELIPSQSKKNGNPIVNPVITLFFEVANKDDFDELCTGWDMNSQLDTFTQN